MPAYYDQAHEIHEFRRLAGVTPSVYRHEKAEGDRRLFAIGAAQHRAASNETEIRSDITSVLGREGT